MSIANKLTYLNDTKGLLKEAINDVGGELTDESIFRSYAEALNGVYDNLPKITPPASNELYFQALRGRMDKTFRGNTSQYSTTGKNLLKNILTSQTKSGITFTVYEDGTVEANGKATANSNVDINSFLFEANKNYFISGCPEGGSDTTYRIHTTLNGSIVGDNDYGQGALRNFETDTTLDVRISVRSGATVNNLIFKPMIIEGTQLTDYEPYTGGKASPNPDYPQDIQVVHGKQYVKFRDTLPKEYTRVDYIESSGTQYIDTGYKPNSNTKYDLDALIKSTGTTKYLISARETTGNRYKNTIYIYSDRKISASYGTNYNNTSNYYTANTKKNFKLDKNLFYVDNELLWTFEEETFTNSLNCILFACNTVDGGGISYYSDMQLYACKIYDNDVLVRDFIPCYRNSDNEVGLYDLVNGVFYTNQGTGTFTYGSEISNTYELNLKSKNLLDENLLEPGSINESTGKNNNDSGVLNTRVRTKDFIPVESNQSYTLSCILPSSNWLIFYFYDENKAFINSKANNSSTGIYTRTTPSNCKYIRIVVASKSATNIQLEQGSTATTYEPYFDYELCKINTSEDSIYKNKQDGKWYLEQQNEKAILDGTQTIDSINTSSTNTTRVGFKTLFQNTAKGGETSAKSAVCNRLNYRNVWGADQNGFYSPTNSKNLYIRILKSIIGTTESTINTWLSSNNLIIYAELVEPVITEITSPTLISQLEAIEAQRSVDGTNVITSECEEGLPVRIGVSALLKEVA